MHTLVNAGNVTAANVYQGGSRSSTPQPNGRTSTKQLGRRLSASSSILESHKGGSDPFATDRPSTSMTERPDTSMSVRTNASIATNAPLAMKKVRKTTTAKKDVPAPKAPRAKKVAVEATKNGSKSSSPTRPKTSQGAANKDKAGDDLENITSGIKKITLVTSKQKQARARENKKPADTSKDTAADGPRGSSLPVTPMEELPSQDGPLPASNDIISEATSPGLPREGAVTPIVDTPNVETPLVVQPPVGGSTSDVFVHYQPNGPTPEALTPQGPLDWLPVNNAATPSPLKHAVRTPSPVKEEEDPQAVMTPSPVKTADRAAAVPSPMKRGDLPVFTPTSQLRFAPFTAERSSASATSPMAKIKTEPEQKKLDDAIWEIPESPQ